MGSVLMRRDKGLDTLHPVCSHSAKLKRHQQHYSVVEKECLALVSAFQKFECYIQDQQQHLEVYTGHNTLKFLIRMKNNNQRLMRWSFLLQPYHLIIHHVYGRKNVIADALTRGPAAEDGRNVSF